MTIRMIAPGAQAGMNVTNAATGNSYTSDANGLIAAAQNDVNGLEAAGFLPLSVSPVVTTAISTATGVNLVLGALNIIPLSTVTSIATLPAPVLIGQTTRIASASTGLMTITVSSLATILTEKAAAVTVLTCALGTCDLVAVGSTLYQIQSRSITSNTSNAIVYGIASS